MALRPYQLGVTRFWWQCRRDIRCWSTNAFHWTNCCDIRLFCAIHACAKARQNTLIGYYVGRMPSH